jgi:hypothetical protein
MSDIKTYAINLTVGNATNVFMFNSARPINEIRDNIADEVFNNDIFTIEDRDGVAVALITRNLPVVIVVIPEDIFMKMQRDAKYAAAIQAGGIRQ